jgi:hypothetical protein
MVNCVPHEVDQRVGNLFQDGLIELNGLTFKGEFNLFAETAGEIANEAGETLENRFDGEHADGHDARLQLLRDMGNVRARFLECARYDDSVLIGRDTLDESGECALGNQQLSDDAHQAVEFLLIDTNGG